MALAVETDAHVSGHETLKEISTQLHCMTDWPISVQDREAGPLQRES